MAEALGYMYRSNGSTGGQQVYLNVSRISQSLSENKSTYRIIVQYRGNGNAGWSNQGNNWSANAGGNAWGGSWRIPNGGGGSTYTLLDTTFTRTHDANGNDSQFSSRADISSTNRLYIGSGSASVTEPPVPRISRKPSAPGAPTFTNIKPTSVTVSWSSSTNNGGASINGYLLRYWPNKDGSGPYIDVSLQNNTSRTVSGLTPGKTYRFVVYAHNSSSDNSGFSSPSKASVVRMFAGLRIKVSGHWKLAVLYVKVNGKWRMAIPYFKRNGTWKMPS